MNLVKYHNDINTLKLGSFGEKELDVFFSILFKLRDRGTEEVTLEYSELQKLANTSRHNARMYSYITGLNKKLLGLTQEVVLPDGAIREFNLFEYIDRKKEWNFIRVKVTETFSYLLNDLIGNYTKFDLKALVSLKSGYSKQLFKLLKQFEGGPGSCYWYWVELEEFKELLGVPENYSTTNFNKKVLKPIEKDLGVIFKNFEITKLTKEGQKVGRGKRIHSLKFTWEKEKKLPQIEPIKYRYEQNQDVSVKEPKEEDLKTGVTEPVNEGLKLTEAQIQEAVKKCVVSEGIDIKFLENMRKRSESIFITTIKKYISSGV